MKQAEKEKKPQLLKYSETNFRQQCLIYVILNTKIA